MNLKVHSESKLGLLQEAEKQRQQLETHLVQVSGDLKSIFRELQTHLIELEFENEELRRSEAELSKLHRHFFELYEHAPVGYFVLSQAGIVLEANSACYRLLGSDREQVVGRSFGRFVHPEWHDRFFYHLAQTAQLAVKNSIELKLRIDEKTSRYILMESIPVPAQSGHSKNLYSVAIDVSERRWALETLQASEEKYRLMFNEMVSGAMIVDITAWENGNPADAVVLDVNPAFERMTGLARENAVGKHILEIFPQTEKYWFEALADTPKLGKTTSVEAFHRQLGRHFALTAFRSKQGHVVITGVDTTELKKGEQALRLELEKRIAERTAELTESIQALEKQIEKREQVEKELTRANEQLKARADQMRRLTGELTMAEQRERRRLSKLLHDGLQQNLVSARMKMGVLRDEVGGFDLKYEMDKVRDLLDESIQMSRSLSVSLSPPVLQSEGLAAGLKWLCKWMQQKHNFNVDLCLESECRLPKDVSIMVFESVRELLFNVTKHAKVSWAHVRLQQIEGAIRLSIQDEGVGFDPGRLEAAPGKDEGLGLFSIRDRINLLGGTFSIDSAPGKGSRFTLIIPCANASKEAPVFS